MHCIIHMLGLLHADSFILCNKSIECNEVIVCQCSYIIDAPVNRVLRRPPSAVFKEGVCEIQAQKKDTASARICSVAQLSIKQLNIALRIRGIE